METLSNLEAFVRSAELGSFSAAARRLKLTPAGISRNVAQLERNLGVRLFQRSTHRLKLTEAGERFLSTVGVGLDNIQSAIAELAAKADAPTGTLKLSVSQRFGITEVLPLLPRFLARYPALTLDLQLEHRAVDLIGDGFDAAIGGGFVLKPGVVTRGLAPAHLVAVASPAYLKGRKLPKTPRDLTSFDMIAMRSSQNGTWRWNMRNRQGKEMTAEARSRVFINDPEGICGAALLGMGVALLLWPDMTEHIKRGNLIRVLPDWYADIGLVSLCFASQKLLPPKTRAFVDFIVDAFRREELAKRYSAI